MNVWLWGNRAGAISCGAHGCGGPNTGPRAHDWAPLRPHELAELGALAAARRETLRCQCGAVEYDRVSRMVRETREGDTQ